MLNNFKFGGPFPAHKLYIHDGPWLGTILMVAVIMIFTDIVWNNVGLALIYIVLGLHVLRQHELALGKGTIWEKRALALACWFGSLFFAAIMPIFALIHYVIYAREIRQKFGDKDYQAAWKTYMRMMALVGVALLIYVLNLMASGFGAPMPEGA